MLTQYLAHIGDRSILRRASGIVARSTPETSAEHVVERVIHVGSQVERDLGRDRVRRPRDSLEQSDDPPKAVNAATGEILRDLIIDPRKDYQPTGRPPGPTKK
jgi:hypothetical protein